MQDRAFSYDRWKDVGRQVHMGERATWVCDTETGEEVPVFFYWQTYQKVASPYELCCECGKKKKRKTKKREK